MRRIVSKRIKVREHTDYLQCPGKDEKVEPRLCTEIREAVIPASMTRHEWTWTALISTGAWDVQAGDGVIEFKAAARI